MKHKRGLIGLLLVFMALTFVGCGSREKTEDLIRELILGLTNHGETEEVDESMSHEKEPMKETDTSGFSYHISSAENIVQDADSGITFVNNEVLVYLVSEDYKGQLEEYIQSIGGEIVGELPEIAEYQILLDTANSFSDIEKLVNTLESFDWVSSAFPNYALKFDESYIPNDKKWRHKWEDVPDGENWGMEAIDAPGAWDYYDQLKPVNIGIFDTMFDTDHEDLDFVEDPKGSVKVSASIARKEMKWSDHGTHVAGIVAASFNNNKGVTGVSVKNNLYGVSSQGLDALGYHNSQLWNLALYILIVKKECRVFNASLGSTVLTFAASRGDLVATEEINRYAHEVETCLKKLIDMGYSFVICKSAGNLNKVGGKEQFFKKDSDDETTPYSYYSYGDYEDYINGDKTNEKFFSRYKDREKEIEGRLESGNVDAKYDILGAITDENVRRRIIIVGAAENLGTHREGGFLGIIGGKKVHDGYKIAAFSQCGKRVDVIAPGVDIWSTIKGGYQGGWWGTSMASPYVAGVAGLIFSANPGIDADKVKEIICDTATGEYGEEKYGMVNAKKAVEAALKYSNDDDKSEDKLVLTQWVEYGDDGSEWVRTEFEYDAAGNQIRERNYYTATDVKRDVGYEYDSAGNQISETYYDDAGNVFSQIKDEYDSNGNIIKTTGCTADGSILEETGYEYDDAGNMTKQIFYSADENTNDAWSWSEFEYNTAGDVIKETDYDENGVVIIYDEYEYDQKGNLIRESIHNKNTGHYEYEYEYDSNKNLTKKTSYEGDRNLLGWEESKYDRNGNKIKYIKYSADGNADYQEEYQYDGVGNKVEYTAYDGTGNKSEWSKYEYDQNGNMIKETNYNPDGSVASWKEYQYEYLSKVLKVKSD